MSADAEPRSQGERSQKLSAMRQSRAPPESMSLDTNNIIQISISAEQSPGPTNRSDPKRTYTFSDSSLEVSRVKKEKAKDARPENQEASFDNRSEEMEEP